MSTLRRKLFRDVGRAKAQFIAVTVTVFLGVALFGASFDSFENLVKSYERTAVEFRFANLSVTGGDTAAIVRLATGREGVEAVATRTVADTPFRVGRIKLLGRLVGLPPTGQPEVDAVKVIEGTYLDPARPDGVLVEEHMAEHFSLGPDDRLSVYDERDWHTVHVVGVVSSPEYIWPARDRQDILTSPDNFGVLFAAESFVAEVSGTATPNETLVFYAGGDDDPALTADLVEAASGLGATGTLTRAEQPSNAALEEDLAGFQELAFFFPILFLTAAAMASYVMLNRLVHAQRPQIGLLTANGFTRRQILRHYLGYGLLPGLAGSIPGVVAGALLARVITRFYTDVISVPVRVIEFHPATIAGGVLLGVGATMAAAAGPARTAARLDPADAMRQSPPAGVGHRSLLERLLPPLRRLPVRWRMALRNIGRNRRRTTSTVLGVVLALTLILVSWGMIDTMQYLMDRQFLDIERQDATVVFAGPAGTDTVRRLEDVEGVAAAEPVLQLPVDLAGPAGNYGTVLTVLMPSTTMHRFYDVDGETIVLPAEGMLAGIALEEQLGVEGGSMVQVTVPALGRTFTEALAGTIDEPLGTTAYLSWNEAVRLVGDTLPVTSAYLRYELGADPVTVREAVSSLAEVAAFEDAQALYETMQSFMGLFYAFVGVMLVFGAAMAFALIFNAMSVNIAERSREVATLLAVGTSRRSVSGLITFENLLVVVLGVVPGLVVGVWVSSLAMASFSSDLFRFDLHMRTSTLVLSALAIVAVALISQWPGVRAVREIDIARVVKERST